MSAQPVEQHWFISLNGKRYGPYTYAALAEAAAKGVIDGETSVWRLGWVKWHPARRVPGLIEETAQPEPLDQASDRENEDQVSERADRPQWQDDDSGGEAPRQQGRPSAEDEQVTGESRWKLRQRAEDDVAAEAPRTRKPQAAEHENAAAEGPRRIRPPLADDDIAAEASPIGDWLPNEADRPTEDAAIPQVPPQVRDRAPPAPSVRRARGFARSAAVGALTVALLAGAGWSLFLSGMIVMVEPRRSNPAVVPAPPVAPEPPPPARGLPGNLTAASGLPKAIAALPAVIALQRNDPAAFARFSKRFADSAANAPEDALPSLARAALRKSVKRHLAFSSDDDTLLEITEVYLAYMKALQSLSSESCVALSDESKGANLTVNLAKDLPALFAREMAVLERVASTDAGATITVPAAELARKYLDMVYGRLFKQPVQSELLGRATLVEAEFQPYCALVIAFYETVLALAPEDRINLLRYLYAAAVDPDDDVQK